MPADLGASTPSIRDAIKREIDAAAAKTLYGGSVIPRPAMRTPPFGINKPFDIWATPECPAVNTLPMKSYAPECSGELEVWVTGDSYKNIETAIEPPPFVSHTGKVRGQIWVSFFVKDDYLKSIDLKTAGDYALAEFSKNLPAWFFLYIPPKDNSVRSAKILNAGVGMALPIPELRK